MILLFKNNADPLAPIPDLTEMAKRKTVAKKVVKIKKEYLGRGAHFFPKSNVGQFLIEQNELKIGERVMIKGSTTGEQILTIEEMMVNGTAQQKAVIGDTCTFKLPFRIRLSDKLYRILE